MGRATILSHLGEGLYRVQLAYDLTTLNGELARLEAAQTAHWGLVLKALASLDDARQSSAEAFAAVNAVLEQWKQALINETQQNPPPLEPPEPNDPETGEPWVDPDRAQEPPFLAAINAARTAASIPALSRDDRLDEAVRVLLRTIAATGRVTHADADGSAAGGRAWAQGYGYDMEIGVGEMLALGAITPEAAVQSGLRSSTTRAVLLNPDYTEVGVAYLYDERSPYTHHWGAIFAAPGDLPPTISPPQKDPAQTAADEAEATLQKIPIPTVANQSPEKLSAACGGAQRAAAAERAADQAVVRLQADFMARDQRITRLTALKAASLEPLDVWMCRFIEDIPEGAQVPTAEPPGDYRRETQAMITVMGQRNDPDHLIPDQYLSYTERQVNLIPPGLGESGRLRHAELMSDAAVFVNLAIEPGHMKWKPIWRYGTLTSVAGNTCSLTLDEITARGGDGLSELPIDVDLNLTNVPISYPPCHGEVFEVGDAVLVLFEGQQRDHPKVIGFRREPRPCPGGRISWEQVQ